MQMIVLTVAVEPDGERHRAGVYRGCAVTAPAALIASATRDNERAAISSALDLADSDVIDAVCAAYRTPPTERRSTVPLPTPWG